MGWTGPKWKLLGAYNDFWLSETIQTGLVLTTPLSGSSFGKEPSVQGTLLRIYLMIMLIPLDSVVGEKYVIPALQVGELI